MKTFKEMEAGSCPKCGDAWEKAVFWDGCFKHLDMTLHEEIRWTCSRCGFEDVSHPKDYVEGRD